MLTEDPAARTPTFSQVCMALLQFNKIPVTAVTASYYSQLQILIKNIWWPEAEWTDPIMHLLQYEGAEQPDLRQIVEDFMELL